MKKVSQGFSSLEVLLTLFFVSVVVAAFAVLFGTVNISIVKKDNDMKEIQTIEKLLEKTIEEIRKDETPDVDSKIDPVWQLNNMEIDSCKIEIKSLSGLLNINTTPTIILSLPDIKKLYLEPEVPSVIENYKASGKLYNNDEQLLELIDSEIMDKYFCYYGYSNINIADDYGLTNIVNSLSKSNNEEYLIQKRKSLLNNKQYIQSEINLKMIAGIEYDSLTPIVNTKPVLNINFVEEDILNALISYQGFNISGVNQKVGNIVNLRETSEISQNEICNILGISKKNELYYYLGDKTWMWQIVVTGKRKKCTMVICRKPEEEEISFKTPEFFVIEKKWYE